MNQRQRARKKARAKQHQKEYGHTRPPDFKPPIRAKQPRKES